MHQTARILCIYNHYCNETHRFDLNVFSDSNQCRMYVVRHIDIIYVHNTQSYTRWNEHTWIYEPHNAARDCGGILHGMQ